MKVDYDKTHVGHIPHVEKMLAQIREIWLSKAPQLQEAIEDSSKHKRTPVFRIQVDISSGYPDMLVSFSLNKEPIKDSRRIRADDTDVPALPLGGAPGVNCPEPAPATEAPKEAVKEPAKGKKKGAAKGSKKDKKK